MHRPNGPVRLLSVLAAVAVIAGCTSDPAPEATTGSAPSSAAPTSDTVSTPDNSAGQNSSSGPDTSGGAGSADTSGGAGSAGASDEAGATNGDPTDAPAEPVGDISCLEVPEITPAGDVPKWSKNDPSNRGSMAEELPLDTPITWKAGVTVTVGKPTDYRPTAEEKATVKGRNEYLDKGEKLRDYISFDVTFVNNSGEALYRPDSPRYFPEGETFTDWPELTIADGEQVTLTMTAAVPDRSTVQIGVEPYAGAADRFFSATSKHKSGSPSGELEEDGGVAAADFGGDVELDDVQISVSAPTPFEPSGQAPPLAAPAFLTGTATVDNGTDQPISLADIGIAGLAGNAQCSSVLDPELGIGVADGIAVQPGESTTVRYGFAAASADAAAVGAPARITLSLQERDCDRNCDIHRGLFTGDIAPAEEQSPADVAAADPLAGAITYVAGGTGAAAFGKPIAWTDGTQVTVAKPKKSGESIELSFLAQGTAAEQVARTSTVTLATPSGGFSTQWGDVDKRKDGYRWKVELDRESGGDVPADLAGARLVIAPAGYTPVVAGSKATPLTFGGGKADTSGDETDGPGSGSADTIPFGETYSGDDGLDVTVEMSTLAEGANPRVSVSVDNTSDHAVLAQPRLEAVGADGATMPPDEHSGPSNGLVPAPGAVIPPGTTVSFLRYLPAEPKAFLVTLDPTHATQVFTP